MKQGLSNVTRRFLDDTPFERGRQGGTQSRNLMQIFWPVKAQASNMKPGRAVRRCAIPHDADQMDP